MGKNWTKKRGGQNRNGGTRLTRDEHEAKRAKKEAEWKSHRQEDRSFALENAAFEAFYRAQHFISDDCWENFMKHLRMPLPACLRLTQGYKFQEELRQNLKQFVGKEIPKPDGDGAIEAVSELKWCPHGYKLGLDKRGIRKSEVPEILQLHEWLKYHTDAGNITRQEAVSMVPPLALKVEPQHFCLDMCASPGSKTSQLLEIVNKSASSPPEQQGLVVANDADTDRAYMLVHQCRRITSPFLVVTTHNGQDFPVLSPADPSTGRGFFDRVLCDVPCSGDGTVRKNPPLWDKWATHSSITLHPLQIAITKRGSQLTKDGGLLTYSTCSMSPYENESVVAELLRSSQGTLELVDPREWIHGFKCRPGIRSWYVLDDRGIAHKRKASEKLKMQRDKEAEEASEMKLAGREGDVDLKSNEDAKGEEAKSEPETQSDLPDDPYLKACVDMGFYWYKSFDDVREAMEDYRNPKAISAKMIRRTHFPPTEEEANWMHLERCMRCVPHDEDTGGFFVATFRKIAKAPKPPKAEKTAQAIPTLSNDEPAADEGICKEKFEHQKAQKQLVSYTKWDEDQYNQAASLYNFSDLVSKDSQYVREDFSHVPQTGKNAPKPGNESHSRSVFYIPKPIQKLMDASSKINLKLVVQGTKVMERRKGSSLATCEAHDFRLLQDGIEVMEPLIQSRKVIVTIQDFCNLIEGGLVSTSTLDEKTNENIQKLGTGSIVCTYKYTPEDVNQGEQPNTTVSECIFHCVCWKQSEKTVNVMMGKVDRARVKHRLESLKVMRPRMKSAYQLEKENTEAAEAAAAAAATAATAEDTTATATTTAGEPGASHGSPAEGTALP